MGGTVGANTARTDLERRQRTTDRGLGKLAGPRHPLPQFYNPGKRVDHPELLAVPWLCDEEATIVGPEVKDGENRGSPARSPPPASPLPFPTFSHTPPRVRPTLAVLRIWMKCAISPATW